MDCSRRIKTCVESEIGKLKLVMLHAPGPEIENMTPENAHKFLFSDILNLHQAMEDYRYFRGTLEKVTKVVYFDDLLTEVISNEAIKENVINKICEREQIQFLSSYLKDLKPAELTRVLIEGLDSSDLKERFVMEPIPNLFFMRDASFTMFDTVMISNMATAVRDRETLLLQTVFKNSALLDTKVCNPVQTYNMAGVGSVEGGDVQIAREDIILCGCGVRSNRHGADAIVEHLRCQGGVKHLILQELPIAPESFIHLDMVFTFLNVDKCMVYKPVILDPRYKTIHVEVNGHESTKMTEEPNLIEALKKLGMDLEPIYCGGDDEYAMAREQWHSGANFFSFAPGKVLGYARNYHTIENLEHHGFDILKAIDVAQGKINVDDYKQCVVTFEGNELSRGGGGARCMTMPLVREKI